MKKPGNFTYNISEKNIQIVDSYKVKKREDMEKILSYLRTKKDLKTTDVLFKRSNRSLIAEWRAHNFLYFFHIFKNHTKDVDLDTNTSNKLFIIGYYIMSFMYNLILPFYKY